MQQGIRKEIGYLVMPAAHGKSFNHMRMFGLVEADMIFNCKGDDTLRLLRKEAKSTSNWEIYDKEWADRLSVRLTKHKWLVMVPAREIGDNIGGTFLGYFKLSAAVWEENLRRRGEIVEDYTWGTEQRDDCELFTSNEQLSERLLKIADKWLN